MSAATSRIMLKVPIRLMLMTRANSSSGCGPSRPTMRFAGPMPAQLIRMRGTPCLARASASAAVASSALVTSQRMRDAADLLPRPTRAPSTIDVEAGDLGAGLREHFGGGLGAEARSAAGDDRGVSCDVHGV